MTNLAGKAALIVGGSRGIGAACARAFAAAGARVAIAARTAAPLESLAKELRDGGAGAIAVPADVRDPQSLQALVDTVLGSFGRLDVAFNNAGAGHQPAAFADLAPETVEDALAVNLRGTLAAMRAEIPAILRSGGGAIVNMSSAVSGVSRMGAYAAAKRGIVAASNVAAIDYAPRNLRINCVSPGPILTERIRALAAEQRRQIEQAVPLGRVGLPEEVAAAVVWLCSDAAAYITGVDLPIDGGRTAMGRA
jgi:NAD(P)-dependent dehydrogenase (short-subunit alcohol dehydrogenase family)